eukprot:scaffold16098_cov80-Skeletonema_menzelii.AAC.9
MMTTTNQVEAEPKRSRRRVLRVVAATLALSACSLLQQYAPPEQSWTDNASLRGRSLSVADDSSLRCRIPREYRLSKHPITPTYLASFDDAGSEVVSNLAQALTGIATTTQVNYAPRRADHSALVETHYPLQGGLKVKDEEKYRGAILLLRNPITAILSSFNAFDARQYRYSVDVVRAPAKEWIRYRDSAQFAAQVKQYERFVIYWMKKYRENREDLLLIPYEGLTGGKGAIFTKQIGDFLDKAEGINTIDPDSVPCIWEKFVHDRWYPHGDASTAMTSFQEGAEDRPLNQDHLRMVSGMLRSLDERFGHDKQFSTIMNSYLKGLYEYSVVA